MSHARARHHPAPRLTLLSVAGVIAGCAGMEMRPGSAIVRDLERANLAVPDDSGHRSAPTDLPSLPETGPITLADLLMLAEAVSPDLAAARSGVGVAAAQAWQASLSPNPRLDVAAEDLSWDDGTSETKTTIGFTQPIILGDRRRAAVTLADTERSARSAEAEAVRRELFGAIAVLHSRLIAIRGQEMVYAELQELIGATLATAQSRFQAKAAPETDVIRPRVELHRTRAAIQRLGHERAAAERELSVLLGGAKIDPARFEGSISMAPEALDVERLEAMVRRSHPLLAVADRKTEVAVARLEQLKTQMTPDLDVRVGVGYDGGLDRGVIDLGVGVTLPLWDARQGELLAARFGVVRARLERAADENELLVRLAGAVGEFEAARAQLDIFRGDIVPDAERAFEQASEGYRAGRTSFLDLLDAQRTLTEARVTRIELAGAAAAARASITGIVGPEGPIASIGLSREPMNESPVQSPERPTGAESKP
jgi:outer membrane protein, heavy metal efflux system